MADQEKKNGEALLGAVAIVTSFVVMMVTAYSVTGAIGDTPLHMPFEKRLLTQAWLSQGWQFFTRNPREDIQTVFVRDGRGDWKPVSFGVDSRLSNWFGLNRKNNAQNVEMGRLMQYIPKAAWLPTQGDPIEVLEKSSVIMTVKNENPHPTICGTVGIVKQTPLPWAWFSRGNEAVMPSKVIKIEVQCF